MKRSVASATTRRVFFAMVSLAHSAATLANEEIQFLAEHAVESAMDSVYMSLPWPSAPLAPDRWHPSVDLASTHTSTDFMDMDGSVVTLAFARGVNARWGYELMATHGAFEISGGDGQAPLTQKFLVTVPLDLPSSAAFTATRGAQRHYAIGAAAVHGLGATQAAHSAQLVTGLLMERVHISDFAMDYRLLDGADAGSSGTLQYEDVATFVTPFVSWQQTRAIAPHWTWMPRAMFVFPLPEHELDVRLTGPQFDVSTPPDGPTMELGDPFIVLGLAFGHRPSGLEIDIGGLLYFPAAESVSHHGVDDAQVLHIAWRRPMR